MTASSSTYPKVTFAHHGLQKLFEQLSACEGAVDLQRAIMTSQSFAGLLCKDLRTLLASLPAEAERLERREAAACLAYFRIEGCL